MNKDIVVIGASAGGMDALQQLAGGLPRDLPAALFVVWHTAPGVRSVLPAVLARAGPLPAAHPLDGDRIERGRVYVAPADHHLLLEEGYMRVTRGPKENRFRPAADPLFRSAAYVYGPRVIGVVLSGALDDGASGLWTVKLRGGTAVVQDPEDAQHRSMPLAALEATAVDHRVPAADIGALLGSLTRQQAAPAQPLPERLLRRLRQEINIAAERPALEEEVVEQNPPTQFTCPECHGVLAAMREGRLVRFRCHTGHAFSAGTLLSSTTEQAEARLWDAVRALDETVMLLNDLGQEFAKGGNTRAAELCFDKAREAHERSQPVREAANSSEALSVDEMRTA